ncbi:YlbG family protein [Vagococcus sp. PNs007]|uniref:YlbG family protein n=1 Tax=Vagococcus proximus TaxID=2991417 RepID=A0ABT5WYG2_9ENTE|nr:YlbG family protein [Vagococcus proximus]MDF0478669.1 YlbG family protein [Vagococcus proximus]
MLDNQENNEGIDFELTPRRSLIVWVYNLRQLKTLKKFGPVAYVSRKMKYVIIYMDESAIEQARGALEKLHFVKGVDYSYRPDVSMDFGERVGTSEALNQEIEKDNISELTSVNS